jgi:hypothetical protein
MALFRAISGSILALVAAHRRPGKLWKGLAEILRAAWRALRRLFSPHRPGEGGACCLELPDSYKRPDPLLYAQYYLMSMGLSVTWDNPDIQLFEPGSGGPESLGGPVSSSALHPNHVYRVRVRIWNGSYDAPAVGLPVHLSFLSFGAGTTSHPIATRFVDLGVKGSPKHPAFAFVDWHTPEAGHFCLQALLDWSDDANPNNNLGQENVQVGMASSPARFGFAIRNEGAVSRRFVVEADSYRLPDLDPCEEPPEPPPGERGPTRLAESRARWERARREQGVGGFPVPAEWTVRIEPSQFALAAEEQRIVTVSVDVPASTGGSTGTLNVNAFAVHEGVARDLIGGVTLRVERG